VGVRQVRPVELGTGKAGTVQVYTHHEGVGQVGLRKVGPLEIVQKGEIRPSEVGVGEADNGLVAVARGANTGQP
jgi:hypothetical protein